MEQNIHFISEVSRRYSKALFKISIAENSEQKIYDEINKLLEIIHSEKKFLKILSSPLLSSKNQLKLINNIFSNNDKKKLNLSKNVLGFLKVLANNGRLKLLLSSLYGFKSLVKSMHQEHLLFAAEIKALCVSSQGLH